MQKAIGIFGGSFNPIHFGHLRTALELCQILDLDSVRFLPCHQPVHKDLINIAPVHRLAMLNLALKNHPQFHVDPREIEAKERPSYMIDTLIDLKKSYPHVPLALIVGSDAFCQLTTWKRWQALCDYAHLVVPIRADKKMSLEPSLQHFYREREALDFSLLQEKNHGHILIQEVTALDISSSLIRCQLEAHYDPAYLLPDTVLAYIKQHHLYE